MAEVWRTMSVWSGVASVGVGAGALTLKLISACAPLIGVSLASTSWTTRAWRPAASPLKVNSVSVVWMGSWPSRRTRYVGEALALVAGLSSSQRTVTKLAETFSPALGEMTCKVGGVGVVVWAKATRASSARARVATKARSFIQSSCAWLRPIVGTAMLSVGAGTTRRQ